MCAWVPPNTTNLLQPMDLTMNKPAKEFMKQLDCENAEAEDLQPIDLGHPVLKELGAKWLVKMFDYISENTQFIVNGFN